MSCTRIVRTARGAGGLRPGDSGALDRYCRRKTFTRTCCAVLVEDQEVEEAPPRKTRAALQSLEAARRGRAAARKLDDYSDDGDSSEDSDRGGDPATRIIEGRKRLRKRA